MIVVLLIAAGFLIWFLAVLANTAKVLKMTRSKTAALQSSLEETKRKKEYIDRSFNTKISLALKALSIWQLLRFLARKDNRHIKDIYTSNKENIRRIIS